MADWCRCSQAPSREQRIQIQFGNSTRCQTDKEELVPYRCEFFRFIRPSPQEEISNLAQTLTQVPTTYIKEKARQFGADLCGIGDIALFEGCDPLSYGCEADVATLSAGLFSALRVLDDPSIGTVYARCPVGGGVAYAVQNRLKKAAAFHIVDAEVEA